MKLPRPSSHPPRPTSMSLALLPSVLCCVGGGCGSAGGFSGGCFGRPDCFVDGVTCCFVACFGCADDAAGCFCGCFSFGGLDTGCLLDCLGAARPDGTACAGAAEGRGKEFFRLLTSDPDATAPAPFVFLVFPLRLLLAPTTSFGAVIPDAAAAANDGRPSRLLDLSPILLSLLLLPPRLLPSPVVLRSDDEDEAGTELDGSLIVIEQTTWYTDMRFLPNQRVKYRGAGSVSCRYCNSTRARKKSFLPGLIAHKILPITDTTLYLEESFAASDNAGYPLRLDPSRSSRP